MSSAVELSTAVRLIDVMLIRQLLCRLWLLLALVPACSPPDDLQINNSPIVQDVRPFFPIHPGDVWIYQVDSIIFDPGMAGINRIESTSWIKMEATERFISVTSGDTIQPINRFWRPDESSGWQFHGNGFISCTKNRLEYTENNLTYLKIPTPVSVGDYWQGLPVFPDNYSIFIAGEPLKPFSGTNNSTLESLTVASVPGFSQATEVLTVRPFYSENLLEYRSAQEKYAKGIGLIYLETAMFDTQLIEPGVAWEEKAQKGFFARLQLVEIN